MNINNDNLSYKSQALQYRQNGWNVIPLGIKSKAPNKDALIATGHSKMDDKGEIHGSWECFQEELVTDKLIETWWNHTSQSNIGIVTGMISNLVVVDIDPKNGGNDSFERLRSLLPQTYIVKTGGGGAHYYFKWPYETPPPTKIGYLPGVDIKGEGGYIVAPPSIHPNDNRYELVDGFDDVNAIQNAPDWLLNLPEEEKPSWRQWAEGAPEGFRNTATASMCGRILYEINEREWDTKGWERLVEWNKKSSPPLLEKELKSIFKSITKRARQSIKEQNDKSKGISANDIVDIILSDDPILFHDPQQDGYIRIVVDNHREVLKINSRVFKQILNKIIWDHWHKTPSSEILKQSLAVLEAKAVHEGNQEKLSLRVAEKEGVFWYDMGDEEWRVIRIDVNGWEVTSEGPILFKRFSHQQPQVEALKNGDPFKFLQYLNTGDHRQQILIFIYLIASFVPDISHPVLILHGEQGSAKSTLLRLIRRIVDPSATELLSFSKGHGDLIQQLAHHYAAYYDNLSSISNEISDLLCRAVTGESYAKRVLYTDDDDLIFSFKTCLALNGINVVAFRSDLLDRSILVRLDRIDSEKRKSEKELFQNFEKDRPEILGGIFDVLSRAMKIKDQIVITTLPRMADFYLWGCAIAEAVGVGQEAFIEAYSANEAIKHEQVVNENPVAMSLLRFMKINPRFEGTPQQLYVQLNNFVDLEDKRILHDLYWPKAANSLTRKMNEIKTDLKALGIEYTELRGEERLIIVTYTKPSKSSDRQDIATTI